MSDARSHASTGPHRPDRTTYVLDTSVLLSDPDAMFRFAEHEVVLPVVVVTELEGKRHHPELGYFARQALRYLDDLRMEHGRLDVPLPVGPTAAPRAARCGSSSTTPTSPSLPAGLRGGDNDTRILAVATNLAADGFRVVLLSKDVPMRVKASAVGLVAEEYTAGLAVESGWTGPGRARHRRRGHGRALRRAACSTTTRPATCPATPGSSSPATGAARWAG